MSCMIEPSHSEISNFDGRVRKWHIYININIYIYLQNANAICILSKEVGKSSELRTNTFA